MAETMNVGFTSTRLSGTDGVSLESRKWEEVLSAMGYRCFYFAGESDRPADRSRVVPEAHFQHPEVQALNETLFEQNARSPEVSRAVQSLKDHLKSELHGFAGAFALDLLVVENALAIPMNVPLGLALAEFIAETGIPTIGHHHDFAWERGRFWPNGAGDYLGSAFPPDLPSLRHVVINSAAARQLALRKGVSSTLIPNVMDFESPPSEDELPAGEVRSALGVAPDEVLLLQPTRIVPRKAIERAIDLARRLDSPATLVVSHSAGDEGHAYKAYLEEYARLLDVPVVFAGDRFDHERREAADGGTVYALSDAYRAADLVTYPSTLEGFGNAFVEAVYYRCPVVVNRYDVFRRDIEPKGFEVVVFDGFVTAETVREVEAVLRDRALRGEMTARNYELGRRYYSYTALERSLSGLLAALSAQGR